MKKFFTNATVAPQDYLNILLIYMCSFIFLVVLIANPGYFSHDELQRFDYFTQHGFSTYLNSVLTIQKGDSFGVPMRPFSFFIQGLQNFFIVNFPVIAHLSAVLVTATVASLLYLVCINFSAQKKIGFIAALIFLVNPLSTLATGWIAALMDQWYILFSLVGLLTAKKFMDNTKFSYIKLLVIFLSSCLAISSKETAIVLPGILLIFLIYDFKRYVNKRLLLVFLVWTIPVILYISFRFFAIKSSFELGSTAPYAASFNNIPNNIFVYFSYPFVPSITEAINWVFYSSATLLLACAYHALIIVIIWRLSSFKYAIGYLVGYFIFLLPILFLPSQGSHYLYGSSLLLSAAIAFIIATKNPITYRLIGSFGLLVLVYHSSLFQIEIYEDGACMNRLQTSLESIYLSNGQPKLIELTYEPFSPAHVLYGFVTGRNQIGMYYPITMKILEHQESSHREFLQVTMNKNCVAFKR